MRKSYGGLWVEGIDVELYLDGGLVDGDGDVKDES